MGTYVETNGKIYRVGDAAQSGGWYFFEIYHCDQETFERRGLIYSSGADLHRVGRFPSALEAISAGRQFVENGFCYNVFPFRKPACPACGAYNVQEFEDGLYCKNCHAWTLDDNSTLILLREP